MTDQPYSSPTSPPTAADNMAATADLAELTPLDEVAIAATSTTAAAENVGSAAKARTDQAADYAKGLVDKAASIAHSAIDKTASTVGSLSQTAGQGGSAPSAVSQALADARAAIEARPIAAIGIAAAVGVVLSLVFSSGSDTD